VAQPALRGAEAEAFLAHGEIELIGRMPWSSNATFLVEVCATSANTGQTGDDTGQTGRTGEADAIESRTVRAVYKPRRGERPLWDFPNGLCQREVAAYELSQVLGWDLVPPTVMVDGPLGVGSVQLFIDADFTQHYFTLYEHERNHPQLQAICAFDIAANNTDRKSGHCLIDSDRHIWGIDNGLSFHVEPKLRTVIWEFGGEEVPNGLARDLRALSERELTGPLAELLDPFERDAVRTRASALAQRGVFPVDHTGRRFPWPLV